MRKVDASTAGAASANSISQGVHSDPRVSNVLQNPTLQRCRGQCINRALANQPEKGAVPAPEREKIGGQHGGEAQRQIAAKKHSVEERAAKQQQENVQVIVHRRDERPSAAGIAARISKESVGSREGGRSTGRSSTRSQGKKLEAKKENRKTQYKRRVAI